MVCLNASSSEDGLATPAAIIVSLAVGVLAAAGVTNSLTQLRLARAEFHRSEVEEMLAGAQQRAAKLAMSDQASTAVASLDKGIEVLLEPEGPKASIISVILEDDRALAAAGVANPQALKERLKVLTVHQALNGGLEAADPSPFWRSCARTLVSPLGLSNELRLPGPARSPGLGELWRVRVSDQEGWVDDRVVRFTGDPSHPAATVARRFWKSVQTEPQCETVLAKSS